MMASKIKQLKIVYNIFKNMKPTSTVNQIPLSELDENRNSLVTYSIPLWT